MGLRGRSSFGSQGLVFFVTTTVVRYAKVFATSDVYYELLLGSLRYLLREHRAQLFGYVFMPSHVHLVVSMPEGESISDFMRDFKKYTSTKIRQQLEKDRQTRYLQLLRMSARGKKNQVFKLWMDRFDDVVIENENTLAVKIEYMHDNPVCAGLVAAPVGWKYSSARNYLLNDHSLIGVVTDWNS